MSAATPAPGPLIRRAGAKLIDFALLGVVWFLMGRLLVGLVYGRFDYFGPDPQDTMASAVAFANYTSLMLLQCAVVGFAYHCIFLARYAATPGKRALGLRVVRADGAGPLSRGQIVGRYFSEWLSRVLCGLGYLVFERERRTLHDRLARTRVVSV